MDAIDYSMINVGAWVRATGHLGAGENRAMRVRTMFVRNGRIGFDAMVSTRDGDPRRTLEERMVWRYMDQVTEVVRAARTRTDWTAERKNLPNG